MKNLAPIDEGHDLVTRDSITLASGSNNGTLKLTVGNSVIDNIAVKGLAALAYKASLSASDIPSLDWSKITTGKPTTLSGYGITDAKIVNGVITLGSNTITPLTSHQSLAGLGASLGAASNALTLKNQSGTVLSTITAANLVTVLGNTAVNRAIADGDGNNIVNTYVNKSTPLFGRSYRRVEFTGFSHGTSYANLDDRYKDGTYHRMWRIRFPNPATSSFWGKIIVTVNGQFASFNASGVLQKTINVAINKNPGTTEGYIYNNGGYYTDLGVNVEKDFRISEMVWNTEAACWEILIKSIQLHGNNWPTLVILEFISGETNSSALYERFVNPVAVLTAELNNDATYKKGGGGAISWLDQPVLQHPYGYDMYHSGNFVAGTDYPSLTGAGASGTWGINISGNAASATALATSRNIWGQSFDGTAAISGDMSSVGKITFTAKTSKSTSGNVLEVVTINGIPYLHTTLPFFSDGAVSAGGIGTGGGGGTDVSWTNGDANYGVLTIAGNAHNVSILGHTHPQYMLASAKGAANGVAELGADSKIPLTQLPDIVMGQLMYGGTVNASNVATLSANVKTKLGISSSTVTLTNGTGTYGYTKFEGVYFIMSADSSFASLDLKVGDWLISTGTAWEKIDNTDAVTGVKGQNQTSYQVGNVNISWDNVKPSAGVAKAELASGVQTSLDLADGALQKERFNVLSKQSGSSLATCDDLIGTCGIFRMGSKAQSETPAAGGYGNMLSMFVPNADTYAQIYLGYYNDSSRNIFFRTGSTTSTASAHRTWHYVIHDGNTSEITSVGTITAGVWHGTAITKTYLASDVQTSLGKADTAYQKASTGIPKTDLESAVQTSLGKADSALQAHQTIYAATFSAGTFSAKTYTPNSAAQTINIPTTTSHISEGSNLYFTNARAVSACSGTYAELAASNTFTAANTFSGAVAVKSLTITETTGGAGIKHLAFSRSGYNYITVPSEQSLSIGYDATTADTIMVVSSASVAPGSAGTYKSTTTLGTAATPWQAVYGKTYYADCTSGTTVMNAKLQNGTTYSIMGASSNTPSGWTGWTTPGVLLGTVTADTELTLRSGGTINVNANAAASLTIRRLDSTTSGCYIRFANNASTNPYIGYFGVYKSGTTVQYRWYKYSTPTDGSSQSVTKIAHLDTDGNFVANGQVTAGAASDLRFKKNIESMSRVNAESILAGLRPVEFDWNDLGTSLSGNKGHDTGLIAQEVLGVFPYAVSPIYERFMRVDYAKLTPILVAGWQSHEEEISQLKRKVKYLEEKLAQLTNY